MIAVGGEACKEDSLCPVPLPAGRESGTVCEVNTEHRDGLNRVMWHISVSAKENVQM